MIELIKDSMSKGADFVLYLAVELLAFCIRMTIILGAVFSGAILYKMFPDTFFVIIDVAQPIITIVYKLFLVLGCLGLAFLFSWLVCVWLSFLLGIRSRRIERWKKRREEFINEVVSGIEKNRRKK